MDFKTASDRLTECVTFDDIARECGVVTNTILRARMDAQNPNARSAPANWPGVLARIARKRAAAFQKLAEQLERDT